MKRKHLALGAVMTIALGGCATTSKEIPVARDEVRDSINDSLKEIRNGYQTIVAIEQAEKLPKEEPRPSDPALYTPLTVINSAAKIEDIVKSLAAQIGYSFKMYGNKPAADTIVFTNYKKETAYDILKDLGAQAGIDTVIRIDQANRLIMLKYLGK